MKVKVSSSRRRPGSSAASAASSWWSTRLRSQMASGRVLNPTACSTSPGTATTLGTDPGDSTRCPQPMVWTVPVRSRAVAVRASRSIPSTSPISSWVRASISRNGMTAWRGSTTPAAASGSSGAKRRKFSGATSSTRGPPGRPRTASSSWRWRATPVPPKPPPTMRTSKDLRPRTLLVASAHFRVQKRSDLAQCRLVAGGGVRRDPAAVGRVVVRVEGLGECGDDVLEAGRGVGGGQLGARDGPGQAGGVRPVDPRRLCPGDDQGGDPHLGRLGHGVEAVDGLEERVLPGGQGGLVLGPDAEAVRQGAGGEQGGDGAPEG